MDLAAFLDQATRIERRAERVYAQLAERMRAIPNIDAAAFFGEMAYYSRLHRQSIEERARSDGAVEATPDDDAESPILAVDSPSLEQAIELALAAERKAANWYETIAEATEDSEVRTLAVEFALEERQHVLALERYLGQRPY